MTLYPAPNGGDPNNQIMGIAVGGDGALWFTEPYANKIGRITTAGVVTEYTPPGSEPWSIVSGPDGALWFTELSDIGRITTAGVTSKFAVPTSNSLPWGLAVGADANMWFTEEKGGKIGRITTAGAITEYPVNSTGNDLSGIASGPDGALWFSDSGANKIGQITTAGVVTEYAIPTSGSGPRQLVAGPDGAIWFTEQNGNKISRLALAAAPPETQLFNNGNTLACSQTGSSQFTLANAANVTHWGVWYYWSSGQTSVTATVKQGSATVFSGNLTRASCDPYQTSWCNADAVASATWPAGAYTVTISPPQMCMNSTSSNQGFVYIYGAWQSAASCSLCVERRQCGAGGGGGQRHGGRDYGFELHLDGGQQCELDHHRERSQRHGQRHRVLYRSRQHGRGAYRHPYHCRQHLHCFTSRGTKRLLLQRQPHGYSCDRGRASAALCWWSPTWMRLDYQRARDGNLDYPESHFRQWRGRGGLFHSRQHRRSP